MSQHRTRVPLHVFLDAEEGTLIRDRSFGTLRVVERQVDVGPLQTVPGRPADAGARAGAVACTFHLVCAPEKPLLPH